MADKWTSRYRGLMRAEIKKWLVDGESETDVASLPPLAQTLLLRLLLGPVGGEGEESCDLELVTPTWLQAKCEREGTVSGRHLYVLNSIDPEIVVQHVEERLALIEGETWDELAAQFSQVGLWEFEDCEPGSGPCSQGVLLRPHLEKVELLSRDVLPSWEEGQGGCCLTIRMHVKSESQGVAHEAVLDSRICDPRWIEGFLESSAVFSGERLFIQCDPTFESAKKHLGRFVESGKFGTFGTWDDVVARLSRHFTPVVG